MCQVLRCSGTVGRSSHRGSSQEGFATHVKKEVSHLQGNSPDTKWKKLPWVLFVHSLHSCSRRRRTSCRAEGQKASSASFSN